MTKLFNKSSVFSSFLFCFVVLFSTSAHSQKLSNRIGPDNSSITLCGQIDYANSTYIDGLAQPFAIMPLFCVYQNGWIKIQSDLAPTPDAYMPMQLLEVRSSEDIPRDDGSYLNYTHYTARAEGSNAIVHIELFTNLDSQKEITSIQAIAKLYHPTNKDRVVATLVIPDLEVGRSALEDDNYRFAGL